jgi:hypothetical protein
LEKDQKKREWIKGEGKKKEKKNDNVFFFFERLPPWSSS